MKSIILGLVMSMLSVVAFSSVAQARTERVKCESLDKRYNDNCFASDEIVDIEVQRQLSNKFCIENLNYGFYGSRVWVDDGCRAIFNVRVRGGFGGGGHGGGWGNRPEITCYSKANRPMRIDSIAAEGGVAVHTAPSGQGAWVISGCERGRGCRVELNCFPNDVASKVQGTDFSGERMCRRHANQAHHGNFSWGAGNYLSHCSVR